MEERTDGVVGGGGGGGRVATALEAKAVFYAIDWLVAKNAQFCLLAPTSGLALAFACLACGLGAVPGVVGGVALVVASTLGTVGLGGGIEGFSLLEESRRRAEAEFAECADGAPPRAADSILEGLARMGSPADIPPAIALASMAVWGDMLASSQGGGRFMAVPAVLAMAATMAYCGLWLRVDWIEAKAAADGMVLVQA